MLPALLQPTVRVYDVPDNTFESDEEEDSSEEEDETESSDEDAG